MGYALFSTCRNRKGPLLVILLLLQGKYFAGMAERPKPIGKLCKKIELTSPPDHDKLKTTGGTKFRL